MRVNRFIGNLARGFIEALYRRAKIAATLLLVFLAGLAIGFAFSDSMTEIYELACRSKEYVVIIFTGEGLGDIFAERFLSMLFLLLVLSLPVLSPYFLPLCYLILLYRGYVLALAVCEIIALFSAGGVLLVIFLIVPVQLCFCLVLVRGVCGATLSCASRRAVSDFFLGLLVSIFALAICALFEQLVIVLIIRPLNFVY